jgi:hypothetical protein
VNGTVPEVPPVVVTLTVPGPSVALAAIAKFAVTEPVLGVMPVTVMPLADVVIPVVVAKLVPVSVTEKLEPWSPWLGVVEVRVGAGGSTVNPTVLLVPLGVVTVIVLAPSTALAAIAKFAVTVVAVETNPVTVMSAAPETVTAVAPVRFVPVSVTERAVLPCTPDVGLIDVTVGAGGSTVNATVLEVPPVVVTLTVPGPSVALAAIAKVAVTEVEVAVMPLTVMPLADTLIAVVVAKLVPVMVAEKVAPCAP